MSRQNGIVDYETDFLPFFREEYGDKFPPSHFPDGAIKRHFRWAAYGKVLANVPGPDIPPFNEKDDQRLILYGLLVAHCCLLDARGKGMTGQITSGTQGSVSAGIQAAAVASNYSDLGQTGYGLDYLRATVPYRSFRYVSPIWNNWK